MNKEFRRALSVLNKQELFDKDVRFRYLAALCLAECSDWEECLVVIGAEDTPELLKCKVCKSHWKLQQAMSGMGSLG